MKKNGAGKGKKKADCKTNNKPLEVDVLVLSDADVEGYFSSDEIAEILSCLSEHPEVHIRNVYFDGGKDAYYGLPAILCKRAGVCNKTNLTRNEIRECRFCFMFQGFAAGYLSGKQTVDLTPPSDTDSIN